MSEEYEPLKALTDRTRKTLRLAVALSRERGHADVDLQDVLDVISHCGSVADAALRETGYCKAALPHGLEPVDVAVATRSAAILRIVANAAQESQALGHHYVGTEHILFALMRNKPQMVPNADGVRAKVLSFLGGGLA
jgi:ATP-dependent Clp protease ATP-binding subunit ClpA